ncbi:hypothetical protein BT69DRAFT_1319321 [Atractiella rhizophila]|nr:hypothetical protein BT69DRAFT_1319321 [Atractiella rhizophila]
MDPAGASQEVSTCTAIGAASYPYVWSVNEDNELAIVWTNEDGTEIPTTIYQDITYGDLGVTGDLEAFKSAYNDDVVAVKFILEETTFP